MKKPDANPEDIYTIPEACKLLGIDRRTLRRWTQAGIPKAHIRKCDNKIVYLGKDLLSCYYSIN